MATNPEIAKAMSSPEVLAGSECDMELVAQRVTAAMVEGRLIDETFIEKLAEERLKVARAYPHTNPEAPGPTLESSRYIVRNLVGLVELSMRVA